MLVCLGLVLVPLWHVLSAGPQPHSSVGASPLLLPYPALLRAVEDGKVASVELVGQPGGDHHDAWRLVAATAADGHLATRSHYSVPAHSLSSLLSLLRAEGEGVAEHEPAYGDLASDGKALHHGREHVAEA